MIWKLGFKKYLYFHLRQTPITKEALAAMQDLAEPQGTEQGSPNAECSATPATDTAQQQSREKLGSAGRKAETRQAREQKTLQASRALTSQWTSTSSILEFEPHCKSTFRSTMMTVHQNCSPKGVSNYTLSCLISPRVGVREFHPKLSCSLCSRLSRQNNSRGKLSPEISPLSVFNLEHSSHSHTYL